MQDTMDAHKIELETRQVELQMRRVELEMRQVETQAAIAQTSIITRAILIALGVAMLFIGLVHLAELDARKLEAPPVEGAPSDTAYTNVRVEGNQAQNL